MRTHQLIPALIAAVVASTAIADDAQGRSAPTAVNRCDMLRSDTGAGVERVTNQPVGTGDAALPAHCEIFGRLDVRKGVNGQTYAIRYHLRLPNRWNGRFFFQGGSGTNGDVGDAMGRIGGSPSALAQGFAVVSQDSGHDNATNAAREAGGRAEFGIDPIARANYGHASLPRVTMAAKTLITRFYSRPIAHSYFVGCSKGGQEGMALAQRYPGLFDGIVAAAPGMSLPKAALAQAWDVQTFARLVARDPGESFNHRRLPSALSPQQSSAIGVAVARACDRLDGLADGMVGAFDQCTWKHVKPELYKEQCAPGRSNGACLSAAQIDAVQRSINGPHDGKGRALYAAWPWDAGIGSFGWRVWKLGSQQMASLNILTGGSALSTIFTVPPTAVRDDPQSLANYLTGFDFARDSAAIFATSAQFPRSAWSDIAARSSNLARFRARGGKLIVPHGVSDPVFSINDTLGWYAEVQRRNRGNADRFARVFPVPGMAHCMGGPATSNFDALAPLVRWVEEGVAPDGILASAAGDTPWPGRTRPLCPYPKVATYSGTGSIESAASFSCQTPERVKVSR